MNGMMKSSRVYQSTLKIKSVHPLRVLEEILYPLKISLNNMSLYEIKQEFEDTLNQYLATQDLETGEVLDVENFELLRKELGDIENKANEGMENALMYRQNIQGEVAMIDSEIERLTERKKSILVKSDKILSFIQYIFRSMYK